MKKIKPHKKLKSLVKPFVKVAPVVKKDLGPPLGRVARLVTGAHTFLEDTLTDIGASYIPRDAKKSIKAAIQAIEAAKEEILEALHT